MGVSGSVPGMPGCYCLTLLFVDIYKIYIRHYCKLYLSVKGHLLYGKGPISCQSHSGQDAAMAIMQSSLFSIIVQCLPWETCIACVTCSLAFCTNVRPHNIAMHDEHQPKQKQMAKLTILCMQEPGQDFAGDVYPQGQIW